MNEMDELTAYLQTVIANLYYYVGRAEEISSDENANPYERIMLNDAWLNLENSILDLESLTHKMMKQIKVAGD
jgi:hypothetical protein